MASELPDGTEFRPMSPSDLDDVLKLVRAHDKEDAAAAAESYADRGLDGQFVLVRNEAVIGVTGARPIPETDQSYWLSWTYMDRMAMTDARLTGQLLLYQLTAWLKGEGARKVFVEISSVDAPIGGGSARGGADWSYLRSGFARELTQRDYYDVAESLTVMGLRLGLGQAERAGEETAPAVITDADEIEETDDAYYIDWAYAEDGPGDDTERIMEWVDKIRRWEGRMALVGVPGNASAVLQQFRQAGFTEEGRLADLIQDGVDEVRLRLDIT